MFEVCKFSVGSDKACETYIVAFSLIGKAFLINFGDPMNNWLAGKFRRVQFNPGNYFPFEDHFAGERNKHLATFGQLFGPQEPSPVVSSFLCWGRTAIAAGREWLADCAWQNVDGDGVLDETETSAADVIKNVRRSYDGGIYGFFRDGLVDMQD